MAHNLQGEVPGAPLSLIKLKVNEALVKIYDETDWSFQTRQSAWLASAALTTGTVTTTLGSTTVTGNAAASAAWLPRTVLGAIPLLSQCQFRNPAYSLYNIVSFDASNPAAIVLTLDRPWMEPVSGAGLSYYIYQAYFPAPDSTFRKFIEIRDTTNNAPVSFTKISQDDLAAIDPQRLQFGPCVPTYAVPWGVDKRTGSATLNYVMYELWPHVLADVAYSFSYKLRGATLGTSDSPPYPISEESVTWRAKEILYQWKEAQKGDGMQRGSGADWRFLAQAAAAEYKERNKKDRAIDANLHREFLTRGTQLATGQNADGYSNQVTGSLNVGSF